MNGRLSRADIWGVTYYLLAAILWLLPSTVTLADVDKARESLRPLLVALAQVESGNKDSAVGDAGKALGRYQLWRIYWADAIEQCPEIGGDYGDVVQAEYAERCVVAYFLRYGRKFVENKDFQALARIHNGGPKGHKRKATLSYWKKVERALDK